MKERPNVMQAIVREIETQPLIFDKSLPIETIYFGGGTPGLLNEDELTNILQALKRYRWSEHPEITLEANPDDITESNLAMWAKLNINRLSVGIQSFQDEELKWMNRSHDGAQAMKAMQAISKSAIQNYSADLIYGSLLLSDDQLKENLQTLIKIGAPHISCYALTVEPATALAHQIKKEKTLAPDPETQLRHFHIVKDTLTASGYEHYEISNFALPGKRSLHNSSYWKGVPYQGFGPSAHSYDGVNIRGWNIANNIAYTKMIQDGESPFTTEVLTPAQMQNEQVMIQLRTIEGIDLATFENRFGSEALKVLQQESLPFIERGELVLHEHSIKLTDTGKFLADGITAALFV